MATPAVKVTGWGPFRWRGERATWENADVAARSFYQRLQSASPADGTRGSDISGVRADSSPPVSAVGTVEPAASDPVELAEPDAAPITNTDPLEEFRVAPREKAGDWFVVHTYSGMENRVKANLENRIALLNMEDYIHEIVIPTVEVAEIKSGQRKLRTMPALPGYVLVRMDLTDESWAAVRHTPSVTGFVGHSHQPVPLSREDVEDILAQGDAAVTDDVDDFDVSDSVVVVDGPFATLHGTITEINAEAQRVKALVELFGHEVPVELSLTQIQKD